MEYGYRIALHTFQLVKVLTNKASKKLISRLYKESKEQYRVFEKQNDADNKQVICNRYAGKGIVIKVRVSGSFPDSIELRVNPIKLLGYKHPSTMTFMPSPLELNKLENAVNEILKEMQLPFEFADMSISRIDSCCDFFFYDQDYVDLYLKVIKKGLLPTNYRRTYFSKKKHDDAKEMNKHSFRIHCKEVTITAYDKVFEVKHEDILEPDNNPYPTLRIEVSVKRTTIVKKMNKKESIQHDNKTLLLEQYRMSRELVCYYIDRINWAAERYVSYEVAELIIDESRFSAKVRQRMKYLLRKTSDSDNISNAIEKLKSKFGLKAGGIKTIKTNFDKLNISPITLPNRSEVKILINVSYLISGETITGMAA